MCIFCTTIKFFAEYKQLGSALIPATGSAEMPLAEYLQVGDYTFRSTLKDLLNFTPERSPIAFLNRGDTPNSRQ
jgi:hypothetical protein